MCAIIDTNVLALFFENRQAPNEYSQVRGWIEAQSNNAKIVIGGTKCLAEIKRMRSYLPLLTEISKIRKLALINTDMVDVEAQRLKAMLPPSTAFDDEHIFSLCNTSGAKLVVTNDGRMMSYYKGNRNIIKRNVPGLKFYTRSRNRNLLCQRNIHPINNEIDSHLLSGIIKAIN